MAYPPLDSAENADKQQTPTDCNKPYLFTELHQAIQSFPSRTSVLPTAGFNPNMGIHLESVEWGLLMLWPATIMAHTWSRVNFSTGQHVQAAARVPQARLCEIWAQYRVTGSRARADVARLAASGGLGPRPDRERIQNGPQRIPKTDLKWTCLPFWQNYQFKFQSILVLGSSFSSHVESGVAVRNSLRSWAKQPPQMPLMPCRAPSVWDLLASTGLYGLCGPHTGPAGPTRIGLYLTL